MAQRRGGYSREPSSAVYGRLGREGRNEGITAITTITTTAIMSPLIVLLPPLLSCGIRKDLYQKQLITRRGCAPLTRLSRIPCPLEARRMYARVANAIPYKWIPPR